MSVEKKSFNRFLFIYISSTLLLLFIGAFYYYKTTYDSIIDLSLSKLKKNIEVFISKNKSKEFIQTGKEPKFKNEPIAIYINKIFIIGNEKFFNPFKNDIDFSKEFYIKNNKLFYIDIEHRKWGNIYIVTYKNIQQEIKRLNREVFLFLFFSIIFIIMISFILGKIFIKPLKENILLLEDFITDTTHEINTPISNILTNIELLKELYPECNNDEIKRIENSAFRISKIFKDLVFVRFNHTQPKNIIKLNLKDIILDRIDFFKFFIENKLLKLEIHLEDVEIFADKEDIIRLIDNLLSNSIKYSKKNSFIKIILDKEKIVFENYGEIKKKDVIKKFIRDSKFEGGFGLGLYIVNKICKYYKFSFSISSKNNIVKAKIDFY